MLLSWLASLAGLVLGLTAAGAAALIVSPAPSMGLAFVAVAAGEKSYVVIGVAVLASVLALLGSRPGLRGLSTLTVLLSLAAIGVGLVAPAQALRLASERRVDLDLGRHLTSRIDTARPMTADKTVTYATVDGQALGLDVYPPSSGRAAASPVIMVIHGGGWSKGTKGENLLFSRWLAERGYAVFDVEYRTSPQPNWKAAIGDVKCAIG